MRRTLTFGLILLLIVSSFAFFSFVPPNENGLKVKYLDENNTFIIMFKDKKYQEAFLKEQNEFEILHVYKLIPAVLVKPKHGKINVVKYEQGYMAKFYRNNKIKLMSATGSSKISLKTKDTARALGATTLWEKGIKGKNVIVGVIDSGVDTSHPDLQGVVIYEKSFVLKKYGYDEDDTDPKDENGHGTMVAGIIAGRGKEDPNFGLGIAPEAKIMSAKIFPKAGTATDAALLAAIEWCVFGDDGKPNTGDEADVINMSLGGGTSYTDPVIAAVEEAVTKYGVVIVVAAGNEGNGVWTMSIASPGAAPSVITVGAVDPLGQKVKTYSSLGPNYFLAVKPDIVGPAGVAAPKLGGGYETSFEGTSAATPHITGLATLLVQYLKEKKVDKKVFPGAIKASLMASAKPVSFYSDLAAGAGFPNVTRAWELLENSWDSTKGEFNLAIITPKALPAGTTTKTLFFPYPNKVFVDQHLMFNFTIVTGFSGTFTVTYEGNITDAVEFLSPTSGEVNVGTNYFGFEFKGKNATLGFYTGNITFKFSNGVEVKVAMNFTLAVPEMKALFDLRHTSWTVDFAYGQFRYFASFLYSQNISIEHEFFGGEELTLDKLKNYDIVFIPDAATPIYVGVLNATIVGYAQFTPEEIEALVNYVEQGGNVIIIGMANDTNFENLNNLTKRFGVEFIPVEFTKFPYYTADVVPGHLITKDLIWLPTWGRALRVNRTLAYPIATLNGYPVYALHINKNGGTAFILGTNFVFDNAAFRGEYGVLQSSIYKFFTQYIEMIKETKKLNIKQISFSPSSPKLGDKVTVNVELSSDKNVKVEATDFVHEYTIGEASAGESVTVTGTYTIELAGTQGVSIKIEYDKNAYLDYRIPVVSATKVETNPPKIKVVGSTDIKIEKLQNITVELVVEDDYKLDYIEELITVEVSVPYANYTLEKLSDTKVKILVQLPIDVARDALSKGKTSFTIRVTAYDVNLNYADETFTFVVQKFPFTLIYISVAIAIVAIVAFVLIRRRKKSK